MGVIVLYGYDEQRVCFFPFSCLCFEILTVLETSSKAPFVESRCLSDTPVSIGNT